MHDQPGIVHPALRLKPDAKKSQPQNFHSLAIVDCKCTLQQSKVFSLGAALLFTPLVSFTLNTLPNSLRKCGSPRGLLTAGWATTAAALSGSRVWCNACCKVAGRVCPATQAARLREHKTRLRLMRWNPATGATYSAVRVCVKCRSHDFELRP